MTSSRGPLRVAPVVFLFVLLSSLLVPVAPAGAADLTVSTETATVDFPTQLKFDLAADAPQPVQALEVWYRPEFSPVTQVSRPDFAGGSQHVSVSSAVDMQLHYLPPGLNIVYHWRLTLQDGSIVNTPEKTIFYMDNRYQWGSVTDGPVTVYYQKGDDQLGQEALKTTTQSIDKFHQTFNITTSEPVNIVVYGSSSAFASALPPNSAEWIGGIAEPELHLVLTGIQPGFDDKSEVHRVLSHESVHLVVGQATDNPFNTPPPWLDEGLATYYQEVPDTRFPGTLQRAVQSGQLIPIKALNSSFPDDPNQAILSYAESESIVTFIIKEKGADKMAALLNAFKQGVSNEQAVETGLGISIDQLDKEWKDWLGYSGDKEAAAAIDPGTTDPGIGQGPLDVLASSTSLLLIGSAAVLCIVAGAYVLRRSHSESNESL